MVRPDFRREDLEDLVGGRLLAWVGGVAVLLGIVFLFALGISNGWIGEAARVGIAAAVCGGLLGLGVWLHESKARTDAALASVATGIAGLFVTITVAAQVYELVPQLLAVLFAVAVGAIATALAVRWESRGIAALGILGGLGAPVLADVVGDGGTMLILFVALASAAAVLLRQRWDWLALAAFMVATPQWAAFVILGPPVAEQLAVLIGFGALGVAVAVGHDVRVRAERLRSSSAYLLALNAIVVAAVGYGALGYHSGETAGNAWVAGVALAHLGVGLGGRFLKITNDLRLLSLVLGAVIADVAFGLIADGPALTIGWAATGVGFALLMRRTPRPVDMAEGLLVQAGVGGHLGLALLSAIAVSDPVEVMNGYEALSPAGAAAVAALAAGCLVSARIAGERHQDWRIALDSIGLGVVAVLTALTLDGLQLVLAWALEVVALAGIGRRTGDKVAGVGALAFLALAATHAIAYEAPPVSLVTGLADTGAALAAVAAVGGCLLVVAAWPSRSRPSRADGPEGAGRAHAPLPRLDGGGHPVRERLGGRLRAPQCPPAGPDGAERLLGARRCGDHGGRPPARPGGRPHRRAGSAGRRGRQGVPVRPGDAHLALPGGLAGRARAAAPRGRPHVAAPAPAGADRSARDAGRRALGRGARRIACNGKGRAWSRETAHHASSLARCHGARAHRHRPLAPVHARHHRFGARTGARAAER